MIVSLPYCVLQGQRVYLLFLRYIYARQLKLYCCFEVHMFGKQQYTHFLEIIHIDMLNFENEEDVMLQESSWCGQGAGAMCRP